MTRDQNSSINGDRALAAGDQDKLGFRELATRIAISLVDRASEDGLVIGVEGAWGSGKSSLLFLISDELEKLSNNQKPVVINFRPWLIGNRDALITALFGELATQLDRVALNAGDLTPISVARAKEAGEALRRFLEGLSRAGDLIEFAGNASGSGRIRWVGQGLKRIGTLVGTKPSPTSLSDLKDKLVKSLRALGKRFVIAVDDVDRLEPTEVIEILRLVRSVVDLPNVIYLLCYDSEILAHSIEKAAGVRSGPSYLEKIVQLTVNVPKPETFQLREWLSDDLRVIASVKDGDELSRLKIVIDYEGGRQLRTPRSVVRTLDSIRFIWPALRDMKADLADLVWLQLIKDGNPKLYRWIENYCGTAAAISLGTAGVTNIDKEQEIDDLESIVNTGYFDDIAYRQIFADQLPGVRSEYSEGVKRLAIFEPVSDHKRDEAIRKRRLASPDHYRIYFALADPSHALTSENFESISAAAEAAPDLAGETLLSLCDERAVGSLTKADLVLERINTGEFKAFSTYQCENLLVAFSQVMDEAYRRHPIDKFSFSLSFWDRAKRLMPVLLSRVAQDRRTAVIKEMFCEGAAVSWLTFLFRSDIFAHGRYGTHTLPSGEWVFSDGELDSVTEMMLGRYKTMSAREVLDCPEPLELLFAWLQAGDEKGPRHLVETNIQSDEGLVETLERLISTVLSSNRGQYEFLRKDNLEPFMDYEKAKQRVYSLENHGELGGRARRLAVAFGSNS